jgi:sarcosine oxidase subunit gamma
MLDVQFPAIETNEFIALAPPRGIVSIAAFNGAETFGLPLPTTPRRIEHDGVTYLWSGPGAWLAIADDPALESRIATAVAAKAAVTDQSDGRVILTVTGPHAAAILAKLVPIDLHPTAFPPDASALTLAGPITVQIWRREAGFHLACFRGFAESLGHALVQASQEFLPG